MKDFSSDPRDGVQQNCKNTIKWYSVAVEQGDDNASIRGEGVIQDNLYAHIWWTISTSQGREDAVEWRDFSENGMASSQIIKVQDLVRGCVKTNYKGC